MKGNDFRPFFLSSTVGKNLSSRKLEVDLWVEDGLVLASLDEKGEVTGLIIMEASKFL